MGCMISSQSSQNDETKIINAFAFLIRQVEQIFANLWPLFRVNTFQKVKIKLQEFFPSLKINTRVMHHTKTRVMHHQPKIDLKLSKPKMKCTATSLEIQIEIENNSQNTISAAFENHFIVKKN